jgi:hypothetical protein
VNGSFDVFEKEDSVMVRRWLACAYLMLVFVNLDCHLAGERAQSTMLSFDIKKKVKHHKHGNSRQNQPLIPQSSKEEEMEFTLRVNKLMCWDLWTSNTSIMMTNW